MADAACRRHPATGASFECRQRADPFASCARQRLDAGRRIHSMPRSRSATTACWSSTRWSSRLPTSFSPKITKARGRQTDPLHRQHAFSSRPYGRQRESQRGRRVDRRRQLRRAGRPGRRQAGERSSRTKTRRSRMGELTAAAAFHCRADATRSSRRRRTSFSTARRCRFSTSPPPTPMATSSCSSASRTSSSQGMCTSTRRFRSCRPGEGGGFQGVIDALNRIIDLTVPTEKQEGGTYVIPGHGRLADEADVVEYRDMNTIIRDRFGMRSAGE